MAHFAEVDDNGKVLRVIKVSNADAPDPTPDVSEPGGQAFIADVLGVPGVWLQTSYSSRGGNRVDPNTNEVVATGDHFRFNYCGIGWSFDPNLGPDGAFIPPQPFPSWVLNPDTALWDAPIPMPTDGGPWTWDEDTLSWVEVTA